MKLKLTIKSHYPNLTKSERKVADYVLEKNKDFLNETLADVANATNVGEATVLRFCNKIGCEKFVNLKILIAQEADDSEEMKNGNILDDLSNEMIEVINNTRQILDIESIRKAVDLIESAHTVFFYGVGSSGLTAMIAQGNFLRIGKSSIAISDSHYQIINSSVATKDDLIVAFSLTGNTKDVYDSCLTAKEQGAKIVAVTNYIESHIAKIADVVLLTAAKEHIMKGGSLAGSITQLYVVDALKAEYAVRNKKKVKKLREKTANSIINKSL